jgi:hypothetical protein
MMKGQIVIGLAILVMIIAGTMVIPSEYPKGNEDEYTRLEITGPYFVKGVPEISSAIALPEHFEQAMVYKTVDTTVSKDDALKMAEKLGMSGPVEEYETSYVIKGNPYTFEIEKETGYMTYTWYGRWMGSNARDRRNISRPMKRRERSPRRSLSPTLSCRRGCLFRHITR